MIDIKDISGLVKLTVLISEGCVHRYELMKEDYVQLVFSLETPVAFRIGDYIEYGGEKYYLTGNTYPTYNATTGGVDYTIRFDSHYYRWQNHILFYDRQGNKEASWSLTRAPEAHLGIVVSNLRSIGFTYNGQEYQAVVDSSVDAVAKLVTYDNTNIIDALTKIAEAWECEWWVEGRTIYIGRLEKGAPVRLEIGKEIATMSRTQSQDIYATRLYVFGGTRNIPSNYREGQTGVVVDGVVQKRLMLPVGTPYIEVVPGLKDEQVVEAVVVFDDIYPRYVGTMSEVKTVQRTEEMEEGETGATFTAYQFKDASLTFSSQYILPGATLRMQFQTGPLSGMEFDVTFNPDKVEDESDPAAQVFEIVRNDDYGQYLPQDPLIPAVGNQYILYNFDTQYVNDALIPEAEQELLDRANGYKSKVTSDPSTYTLNMNSYRASGFDENNGTLNPEKEIDLTPGQQVNMINPAFFTNGRVSRIIGYQKKLDYPYDAPTYTVGETAAYSRFKELEQKIDSIQYEGNTYVNQGGGGAGFYLIKKDDPTAASDSNVFSALRTLYEINRIRVDMDGMYLRKDIDDTAHGNILFDKKIGSTVFLDGWDGKGWEIQSSGDAIFEAARVRSDIYVGGVAGSPTFASGFAGWGWQIDTPTATGEMDNLFVRKTFTAYEVVYSQIYGLGGSQIVSDINKIGSVEVMPDRYRCHMDDMEGLMLMNLREGDGVRIQSRTGTTSIKYLFGRCVEVGSDYFDIALPLIEGTGQPEPGDFALRWGNDRDTDRQGLIYLTSADSGAPFIDVYDGITTASTEGKLKARLGHLTGIVTQRGDRLTGYGAYLNGIYVENSTYIMNDGNTIEQAFVAMNGRFESLINGVREDMSMEEGNILRNSSFTRDTHYWTTDNAVYLIDVQGAYLFMDGYLYVEKERVADIYNDNGRNVLRLRNAAISQPNAVMDIPSHGEETPPEEGYTYSFALFYRVLREGTLKAGFQGSGLYLEQTLQPSEEYQKLSMAGKWDETGDFRMEFTGEILIYGVSLFADTMADALIRLQTRIEQTEESIKLMATKEYVDSATGGIYQKYDAQLSVMATQISQKVTYTEFESETNRIERELSGQLDVMSDRISANVTEIDNINHTIDNAGWLTTATGNTLYAKKEMENGGSIISAINQTPESVKIQAKNISLEGTVAANNSLVITDDSVTVYGELHAQSGSIGMFDIVGNNLESDLLDILYNQIMIRNTSGQLVAQVGNPGSSGTQGNLYACNRSYGSRQALHLQAGHPTSASDSMERTWVLMDQYSGWGAEVRIGARNFGDSNGQDRTVIRLSSLPSRSTMEAKGVVSSPGWTPLYWDAKSGYLAV